MKQQSNTAINATYFSGNKGNEPDCYANEEPCETLKQLELLMNGVPNVE